MSKYLKYFNEDAEYHQFKETDEYIEPNVSFVENSDVVYFNPFVEPKESRVVCTYNVTTTTSATQLCNSETGFTEMIVDGVSMTPSTSYIFNTVGEHTVEFILTDNTTIGEYAFYKCLGLTSVVIPYSVTSISGGAFYGCKGLTGKLVIPDSVTSIGERAFDSCNGLTSVVIGSGVTSIGSLAFYQCSGLTSVVIPSGVTSIGTSTFQGCKGLTEITSYAVTAPTIDKSAFRDIASNGILYYPAGSDYSSWLSTGDYYLGKYSWFSKEIGVELPELTLDGYDMVALVQPNTNTGATQLCKYSTGITEISINGSVLDSISTGYTFSTPYSWNVVRYKFTDSTKIPSSNFTNTQRMYEVKISNSVTSIGSNAFTSCYGLTSVVIGSGVTTISNSAFSNCYGLTSLVIPDSVTSIGTYAFNMCSGLTSVIIPDSVTTIGNYAFNSCSSLTSVIIPDSVTSIGSSAFSKCYGLTGELIIPSGVTSIGNGAFSGCTGLTTIVVSEGNFNYDSREKCNCIIETSTNKLIQGCNNSFIPDSVTSIGSSAFTSCYGLTGELVIPDSVTTLGDYAFCMCSGLTSVVIPDSVTSIGTYAFNSCSSLTSVVIPSGVTSIGVSAFQGCNGLTSIVIPDSVTTIGDFAFSGCKGLTSVVIPDSVTTINRYAFRDCEALTSVIIPDSVTTLGDYAFYSCSGLTSVVIGSGVTSIGTETFYGDSGLTSVVIPDSVTSIGRGAFQQCSDLTSVVIPSGVKSIGSSAFQQCSDLTSVVIPSGVTSIGSSAFDNCTKLTEITSYAVTAPTIDKYTFRYVASNGKLYYPVGSDYSSWLSTGDYYLGKYNWTGQEMYVPTRYYNLQITADDVNGKKTNTTIYWSVTTDGYSIVDNSPMTGIIITGTSVSDEFLQNTSETETVERVITFEYQGLTATTTITQGIWVNQGYTIDLNNQWQLSSTITNPDSSTYDGVYESFSNKGVDDSVALMYIDIVGYTNFSFYVRSYAESSYDYLVVSNLDCTLTNNTVSGTNVKMTTKGKQNGGTAISNYTLVEFTGIDGGEHRITVMYRKDGSDASGDDRGYVIIPKI